LAAVFLAAFLAAGAFLAAFFFLATVKSSVKLLGGPRADQSDHRRFGIMPTD
jgi:hypothetical protein